MATSNRREFMSTAAAAAGTVALSTRVIGAEGEPKLKMGVIGPGWYGMVDAKAALKVGGVEIVAVCDVDREHLEQSAADLEKQQGKRPQTFKLYEEMLDTAELDVLVIGSPPHWHALHLIAALERGLDDYCEKPVSYDVREGRAMVDAVKKSGRVVQVGFQRRQSLAMREAVEFINSGGIGELVQVDAQIHYRAGLNDPQPQDPPSCLDWDLWCGPGPLIPFSTNSVRHNYCGGGFWLQMGGPTLVFWRSEMSRDSDRGMAIRKSGRVSACRSAPQRQTTRGVGVICRVFSISRCVRGVLPRWPSQ